MFRFLPWYCHCHLPSHLWISDFPLVKRQYGSNYRIQCSEIFMAKFKMSKPKSQDKMVRRNRQLQSFSDTNLGMECGKISLPLLDMGFSKLRRLDERHYQFTSFLHLEIHPHTLVEPLQYTSPWEVPWAQQTWFVPVCCAHFLWEVYMAQMRAVGGALLHPTLSHLALQQLSRD